MRDQRHGAGPVAGGQQRARVRAEGECVKQGIVRCLQQFAGFGERGKTVRDGPGDACRQYGLGERRRCAPGPGERELFGQQRRDRVVRPGWRARLAMCDRGQRAPRENGRVEPATGPCPAAALGETPGRLGRAVQAEVGDPAGRRGRPGRSGTGSRRPARRVRGGRPSQPGRRPGRGAARGASGPRGCAAVPRRDRGRLRPAARSAGAAGPG